MAIATNRVPGPRLQCTHQAVIVFSCETYEGTIQRRPVMVGIVISTSRAEMRKIEQVVRVNVWFQFKVSVK